VKQVEPIFKEPKPAKRKPWHSTVPFKSAKRADRRPVEERLFAAILERDGGCVVAGELWVDDEPHVCEGPDTPHHRRKQSAQGGWTMHNLVVLCAKANSDVERFPAWVREHYPWLVVRFGDAEYDECGAQ
jgi:hypothetical protein